MRPVLAPGSGIRAPLDLLEGNPSGMLPVDPEREALDRRAAGLRQNDRASQCNRIAARLTAVAVMLSSAACC